MAFKAKNKNRVSINNKQTIDATHQNMLDYFNNQKELLPDLKDELEELNLKLVDLNNKTLDTKWMSHEEHVTRNRALKESGYDQVINLTAIACPPYKSQPGQTNARQHEDRRLAKPYQEGARPGNEQGCGRCQATITKVGK